MTVGSRLVTRDAGEYIIDKIYFLSGGNRIIGWVMRPPGKGPYPIVIYNHGSRISHGGKPNLEQPTLGLSTRAWPGVMAGRCVLFFPEGSGYAGSEGPKLTECRSNSDVMHYLRRRADDVSAGVNWLQDQPWADTEKIGLTG